MSSTNPSFVLEKPGKVTYEDRPVPTIQEDSHDVIVEVKFTGICGSDVHYYSHGRIGHFVVEKPMVLGHEVSSDILSLGSCETRHETATVFQRRLTGPLQTVLSLIHI